MKLTFIGATHEVTGSCFLVEGAGKKFVVDCGMEQGPNIFVNVDLPVNPGDLDFALLTHAHIDHSGNLPKLYKDGFQGPIYATEATCDLCDIMLRDSAHIQMFEAEWRNRKGRRAGKAEFIPAYTVDDAMGAIRSFVSCEYNKKIQLSEGIEVRFVDAGHLLGSSSIEIWITEEGQTRKLVFSGDIGNTHQPLIKDPTYLAEEADYVIMESTYGDRSHGPRPEYVPALAEVMQRTFDRGGNLVIPSFAVGRTQEMLYFIRQIKADRLLQGHNDFEVYVDSPLAVEATTIFDKHREDYDEEAMELLNKGVNPISFHGLKVSITSEDSKQINLNDKPKVIISASGMCDAGRIKHHLKHNLWRPECTICFVGYQSVGTLGRALVEGAATVKLFGEEINVAAEICQLPGISGHADNEGLMKWASTFRDQSPKKFFVVHGEDKVTELFAARLQDELGYDTMAPYSGTVYDLMGNVCLEKTVGIPIPKKSAGITKAARTSPIFEKLWVAGQRLLNTIRHNEGGTNKDLEAFTKDIDSLCDKWER